MLLILFTSCQRQPEAPRAETVLEVFMTQDWADTAPFLAAVREFEEANPGVRIKIEKFPIRRMVETVRSRVETGNPPDVVQWHAFAAGAQGLAEPLDDLWAKYDIQREEFFPGAIADVVWGSRIYGVPLDTNALVLFYNASAIEGAKLPMPLKLESFGDLEKVAEAVTLPDGSRKALAFPNSYWSAYGWIRANGGEVVEVDADGTPRFTLDAPAVVEAVSFLSSLVRKGYALPPAGADSDNDIVSLFRAGSTAFMASGSWDLATLGASPLTFDVTLMPKGVEGRTEGSVMGGSSLFVPKGSKNADLAFQFMNLLTSDRYALRLAKEQGRLPARSRVFEDPYFQDPKMKVFLAQLQSAHPLLIEAFPEAAKAYETALNSVLTTGSDPAEAFRAAQDKAQQSVSDLAAPG
jgi:ABC-type glycerol-3-phosphate transport system substrate-binding protein